MPNYEENFIDKALNLWYLLGTIARTKLKALEINSRTCVYDNQT